MKVIVTGGSGVAGPNVIRTLTEAGHEVINVDLHQNLDLPCSAFLAAVQGSSQGHELFLVFAADTSIPYPSEQALKDAYGLEVQLPPERGPYQSLFDCTKMKDYFGWTAERSWRNKIPDSK